MRQILIAHGFEPKLEQLGDMGLDELRYRAKGLAGLSLTETHRIPRSAEVTYRRVQHAAHGATSREGWDLEEWDAIQLAYDASRPSAVPADAKKSHGYLDSANRQHVVYTRREKDERGMCVLFAKRAS